MRSAVSLVLAATLFTTPVKLVLAQADQQEAANVQHTVALDSTRHHLIQVPPVTPETARLWELPAGTDARADVFAYGGGIGSAQQAQQGIPLGVKIVLVVVVLAAAALVLIVVLCSGGSLGESC
jgi:hypothetical protein